MPKEYTDIRDSLVKEGKPYDKAQSIAAAVYNKRHPGHSLAEAIKGEHPQDRMLKERMKKK